MLYVLTLGSAAFYGAADFLGGLTSRRTNAIAAVVISQFAGLIALGLMLPMLPAATPTLRDWMWGAAAGLAGGVGVALLYHALAIGSMAIVAPITAVCAVTLPVATAIALGDRPGPGRSTGIALAMIAIALVSQQTIAGPEAAARASARWTSIWIALASGVAIGLFFLTLTRISSGAGLWPLVAARTTSFALFAAIGLVLRKPLSMPPNIAAIAIGGGVLDMLANVLYLTATRYGPLSIVVTLSSLYPASTVLLARAILGERLNGRQAAGIACALSAVMLIVGTQ